MPNSMFYEILPSSYPKNYAELNVFYDNFEYILISQYPKITSDEILGTIGGLVGLFLGASLVSFGELFELFISIVNILFIRSTQKRNQMKGVDNQNTGDIKNRDKKRVLPSLGAKMRVVAHLSKQKVKHTSDDIKI